MNRPMRDEKRERLLERVKRTFAAGRTPDGREYEVADLEHDVAEVLRDRRPTRLKPGAAVRAALDEDPARAGLLLTMALCLVLCGLIA